MTNTELRLVSSYAEYKGNGHYRPVRFNSDVRLGAFSTDAGFKRVFNSLLRSLDRAPVWEVDWENHTATIYAYVDNILMEYRVYPGPMRSH